MYSSGSVIQKCTSFVKGVVYESKKVVWPERQDVIMTSVIVFIISFIFAVFFFVVDSVLGFSVRYILSVGF